MTRIEEVIEAGFADLRTARERLAEAMRLLNAQQPAEALEVVEDAYGLINGLLEPETNAKRKP